MHFRRDRRRHARRTERFSGHRRNHEAVLQYIAYVAQVSVTGRPVFLYNKKMPIQGVKSLDTKGTWLLYFFRAFKPKHLVLFIHCTN